MRLSHGLNQISRTYYNVTIFCTSTGMAYKHLCLDVSLQIDPLDQVLRSNNSVIELVSAHTPTVDDMIWDDMNTGK